MEPLVSQLRHVSERFDHVIAEEAHSRERLNWTKVMSLLEEVVKHPRNINSVIDLARTAPALEEILHLHQHVMDTITQCNETLHGLLQEEMAWDNTAFPQTRSQLLSDVQHVSERIDHLTAEVTRRQEALHWTNLLLIVQEIKSNPRDIAFVTRLARAAPDLRGFFQLHLSPIF